MGEVCDSTQVSQVSIVTSEKLGSTPLALSYRSTCPLLYLYHIHCNYGNTATLQHCNCVLYCPATLQLFPALNCNTAIVLRSVLQHCNCCTATTVRKQTNTVLRSRCLGSLGRLADVGEETAAAKPLPLPSSGRLLYKYLVD